MRDYRKLALTISIFIHSVVLFLFPFLINTENKKENTYKMPTIEVFTRPIEKKEYPSLINNKIKKLMPPQIPPPYKELAKREEDLTSSVFSIRDDILKVKMIDTPAKNLVFSHLPRESELKKNPAYLDYYHLIRERIRINAYRYYRSSHTGEVFLTFIVLRNGKLVELYLDKNSHASRELIDIAIKSIKDASPFPPFPKELDYPKLQFNISIYFKSN